MCVAAFVAAGVAAGGAVSLGSGTHSGCGLLVGGLPGVSDPGLPSRTPSGSEREPAESAAGLALPGAAEGSGSARRKVRLLAVGDILLARGIGKAIAAHGPKYPFEPTRSLVKSADIAVFNLECVLSRRGVPQHERYRFRADPTLAATLADDGFKVAILANNHSLDYGREPLMDTVHAVEAAGMTPVGGGEDRKHAAALKVIVKNGLRVGFLAYTDMPNVGTVRLDNAPTVAGVNDDTLQSEVRTARKACDVLIVFFHWGVEYMYRPTERQRELARKGIDAGADLILGCHPHVLQTVERYNGKPIVYSMGGFVFDSTRFGSDNSAMFFFELGVHSARLTQTLPIVMKAGQTRPAHKGNNR